MRRIFFRFSLIAAAIWVVAPSPASASTVFLDEPFGASWTAGSDWIVASGSSFIPAIATDGTQSPVSALRLTDATNNQNSAIFYADPQPTSQGLDVSFRQSQWGGNGADGIAFFLQKGSETSTAAGSLGGALGYSAEFGVNRTGMPSGLLGIGLDRFGNFVNPLFGGSNCTDNDPSPLANSLVIRGPGNGLTDYCRLGYVSNADTDWSTGATTRAGGARSVRITVDPSTAANPQVKVWVCAAANRCNTSTTPTLSANAPAALLAEPTVRFGFSAGTGGLNNNHEIWDLQVASINVFPAVAISTTTLVNGERGTAYNQTISATGIAPVTFAVTSGNLPGGLSLDATTGAVTGTPSGAGSFTFTVRATDNRAVGQNGRTADQSYTVVIAEAPTTTTTSTTTSTTTTTVVPTTTVAPVTPPSNQVIKTLPVKDIIKTDNVAAGSPIKIETGGFAPNETVAVGIAGARSVLSTTTADSDGDISVRVSLPSSSSGEVTVYAFGQTSKRGFKQTVDVGLPATGADSSGATNLAVALLAIGVTALIVAARRTTVRTNRR